MQQIIENHYELRVNDEDIVLKQDLPVRMKMSDALGKK